MKLMKFQILNKVSFGYELGYALDSAKPREGANLVSAGIFKSDNQSFNKGDVVTVETTSIQHAKINEKHGLTLQDAILVEKCNERPSTARELFSIAQELSILKIDDDMKSILESLHLLKNWNDLPKIVLNAQGIVFEREIPIIKDDTKQIVYGVVYEPFTGNNLDAHGDYATEEEIEKTAHLYLEKFNEVSLMHEKRINSDAKVVESFIAPCDYKIGAEQIKKGSWVMATHVINEKLWKAIQDKQINAYSIEGTGQQGPELRKSFDGQEKLQKRNLVNMVIDAVALVDKGANKKKFYLLKRKGDIAMDKELAISLVKSLTDKVLIEQIINSVDESDREEVKKALPAAAPAAPAPKAKPDEEEKPSIDQETMMKIVNLVMEKLKSVEAAACAKPDIKKYLENPELDIPEELVGEVIKQLTI